MLSAPSYVVQTWYLEVGPGQGYYRLELAPHRGVHARRLVLVTRDVGVYQDALDAEGHDVQLVARYHFEGALPVCDELLPFVALRVPADKEPHDLDRS